MGKAWRWRRCPACQQVSRAGQFGYVGEYGATWERQGVNWRRCPSCGHEAPTSKFRVVREKHQAGYYRPERPERKAPEAPQDVPAWWAA